VYRRYAKLEKNGMSECDCMEKERMAELDDSELDYEKPMQLSCRKFD